MNLFSPFEFYIQVIGKEKKTLLAEKGPWYRPDTVYSKARCMQKELNEKNSYVQMVMRLRNGKSLLDGK